MKKKKKAIEVKSSIFGETSRYHKNEGRKREVPNRKQRAEVKPYELIK